MEKLLIHFLPLFHHRQGVFLHINLTCKCFAELCTMLISSYPSNWWFCRIQKQYDHYFLFLLFHFPFYWAGQQPKEEPFRNRIILTLKTLKEKRMVPLKYWLHVNWSMQLFSFLKLGQGHKDTWRSISPLNFVNTFSSLLLIKHLHLTESQSQALCYPNTPRNVFWFFIFLIDLSIP